MKILKLVFLFVFFTLALNAQVKFTDEEIDYINKNRIKVAMLPDFPPFSIYEDNQINGFSHDILELIAKKSSLKFEYKVDKWPENLKKFEEKKVDIIDAISYRDERLSFTNFTKPYYEIPLVIFSRKGLIDYKGFNSLKGKKLGLTKNIFYKKDIENLNFFEIHEYKSFEDKLRALAFGEIELIFGHLLSTQEAIKRHKYTNFTVLDELNLPNLKKTDLRFGITKENKILFNIIQKTFDSISEAEWNSLNKKWIDVYATKTPKEEKLYDSLSEEEKKFLADKKINCVVSNWPPFISIKDNNVYGIAVDIWDEIKKNTLIDSSCEISRNFQGALNKLKDKKADIIISTTITDDKLSYSNFSNSYLQYPIAIATTMDKRYLSDITLLNGKKVAVAKGHGAAQILKEEYPQIEIIEYENNFYALKALSDKEVYAAVEILPVLSHTINENGFNDLKISGVTNLEFGIRFMVRDDYKELIPILNKAIDAIPKDEIEKMKNRWTSVKFEKFIDYAKLWQWAIVILIILVVMAYRQMVLNVHNRKLQEANKKIESQTEELQERTKELAKQKKLFEKIFIESSDGVFLLKFSDDVYILRCNERAYQILGYDSKEEFKNRGSYDFLPKFQPDGTSSFELINNYLHDALTVGHCNFELIHERKDGSDIWLDVVLTSIKFEDEEIIHVVWRDIRERKDIEDKLNQLTLSLEERVKIEVSKNEEKTKQLVQQSRLAQMGEMISMIAHQWRQPLTAISATTNNILIRLMIGERVEDKELQKELQLVSDYSQHLSMTIDDFRNFFKMDKEKVSITLEKIIESSLSLIKKSLDSNQIKLITDFECNRHFSLHATEINQVILNLIKNAEDALIENLVLNSEIRIKTYIENSNAVIEISDNANGINEVIIDKIFDPYFSTKKEKDGTGLGLYMSKIIINDHAKGKLSVKNGKDGAIFKICLPIDE